MGASGEWCHGEGVHGRGEGGDMREGRGVMGEAQHTNEGSSKDLQTSFCGDDGDGMELVLVWGRWDGGRLKRAEHGVTLCYPGFGFLVSAKSLVNLSSLFCCRVCFLVSVP